MIYYFSSGLRVFYLYIYTYIYYTYIYIHIYTHIGRYQASSGKRITYKDDNPQINSFQTQVLDRKKFGKDIYQIAFRKAIQSS